MIEAIATYFAQNGADWLQMVAEHLAISATALLVACALALPLGVACSASALTERLAGGVAGVFRVIPSLAVLILCVPVLGVGTPPAVAALTVLAIPPILINTAVAFRSVPAAVIEAALGMGMSEAQVLLAVRLPLAMPAILAGLRLACVSTVGIATVAAAINAGGLGAVLFSGLRTMNIDKILGGTICCAALALAFDAGLGAAARDCERRLHVES